MAASPVPPRWPRCWVVAPELNACVVTAGTIPTLPEPMASEVAVAINTNGLVLGDCYGDITRAVVWTNGSPTVLPTLGGADAAATGINNLGQVAGTSQTSTGAEDGVVWSNCTMADLGPNFSPVAINDSDVIIGGQLIDSGGTLLNLNTLIPAGSHCQIQSATGINDNGQIIANANDTATGQTRARLLTPN